MQQALTNIDTVPRWRLPESLRVFSASPTTSNRRQEEFLAVLSHELRSPLAAIRTAVYLMGRNTAGPAVQQKARLLIDRQVAQMLRLVDDLLEVTRVGDGRLSLHCEPLDLRCVIQNAIETVEPRLAARQHRLAVVLPDAPVWVRGDALRLEQVFVNLLVNAAKYSDLGSDLSVSVQAQSQQALVCVRDSGIGIAPEMLPRIFELFVQVDATSRQSEDGQGIGLALVRELVELHGGRIHAASAGLGQGSEFSVSLPIGGR